MADHTLDVRFEVSAAAATKSGARTMIIDRMANAALGGSLGANPHADLLARAKATEVYVMVVAMMEAINDVVHL